MPVITADAVLNGIITNTMLQGVLDEVTAMLPILIPVLITFLAIRKGISFVMGELRGA